MFQWTGAALRPPRERNPDMNRNHQVTREDYAKCVKAQIDFLRGQDGAADPGEWDVTDPDLARDLAMFYDNSVSVDAAAADLYARGF